MPQITIEDLETIRDALGAAKNYFELQDLQWQVVALRENPKYSPLTNEVANAHEKIENVLKRHLLEEHDAAQPLDELPYSEEPTYPWDFDSETDDEEIDPDEEWTEEDEERENLNQSMINHGASLQERQEAMKDWDSGDEQKIQSVLNRFGFMPGAGGAPAV